MQFIFGSSYKNLGIIVSLVLIYFFSQCFVQNLYASTKGYYSQLDIDNRLSYDGNKIWISGFLTFRDISIKDGGSSFFSRKAKIWIGGELNRGTVHALSFGNETFSKLIPKEYSYPDIQSPVRK